ncbi:MAG: FAD-dependent oxidoreductase [Synergistales bacterium]|nr:FAD-dependent oxidoreductase [Synergistales bacterium]
MKDRTVRVILNGREVLGYPGQRLLDLCEECGVEIPALCYDPHLSLHGGCSICLVEVEGAKSLVRACAATIRPDMVVHTNTDRVRNTRKLGLELLFSDHVGDCRPPCTLACPARGDVQGYVNLAAQGKYHEALDTLHNNITLPASIGRVCPAPCEEECRRNLVDHEAVSIREIKRFIGDSCIASGDLGAIPEICDDSRSVGVVGGGPAGLSAAYYLRLRGYEVHLYEREEKLGGMMRYGIPDYRLPQEILDTEIEWLMAHGVRVHTGTGLGEDISMEELRDRHEAVLLAMGCWTSTPLRCPGKDLSGVEGGIEFLYRVNTGEQVDPGRRVAVVGGGNTAMDACRCAKRLGAEKVSVVYRRTHDEMPAEEIEYQEAVEEGIEFLFLSNPCGIQEGSSCLQMECETMELGEPDASGRRRPVPTGEKFMLEVDKVIAAIGQRVEFGGLPDTLHDGKNMVVDDDYATPLTGVFVCGDMQTGPDIAVGAIGGGHWAAESIHHYLTTGKPERPFEYDVTRELTEEDFKDEERIPREHATHDPAEVRLQADRAFAEYNRGLTEEQVLRDAGRCMECGCPDLFECKLRRYGIEYKVDPDRVAGDHISKTEEVNQYYIRNMDKCILCGRCVRACDELAGFHAIDFSKRGFESSVDPEYFKDIDNSDCTQCGLCVQLCPVGALTEKRAERWPHSETPDIVTTHCSSCPVGCQLELNLDSSHERVVRITTDLDDPTSVSAGNSCALGRFDYQEDRESRLTAPRINGRETSWKETLDSLAETLKESPDSDKTGILVHPSLTNEVLAGIGRLTDEVLPGASCAVYGTDEAAPLRKAMEERWGTPLGRTMYDDITSAEVVLLFGTRTDVRQPVLSSWLRKAMRHSHTKVIYVGSDPGMLNRGNTLFLNPLEGSYETFLKGLHAAVLSEADLPLPGALADYTPGKTSTTTGLDSGELIGAAELLVGAGKVVTLVSEEWAALRKGSEDIVHMLDAIKQKHLMPLYVTSNALGAVERNIANDSVASLLEGIKKGSVTRLLAFGMDPLQAGVTVEELRGLDTYALAYHRETESADTADYILPIAHWMERDGSITTLSGEHVPQRRALATPGEAVGLCWIMSALARRLGLELPAATPICTH